MSYQTCQLCGRSLKMRKDKRFPTHKIPREDTPVGKPLRECIGSQAYPYRNPYLPS
jgi:hypothetical protein